MSMNAKNMSIVDNQKKEALIQIKGSKTYCVRIQSDKYDCIIVSACTVEDGAIILSDRGNNKLKHVDSSTFNITDYCDLPDTPWQVCSINKQQAAVCLPNQLEVQLVSLINRMKLTSKVITDFKCYGLAYADGNLYISDSNTSVYIYSVSGRKMKKFSKDQSGQTLCYGISSLAVSDDVSRIYVADCLIGLIVLDFNGKVVGRFNGSHLQGAYDSYLTGKGSLLVSGFFSNNVLQFGLNGELIGEVVSFDPTYTKVYHWVICCNSQMTKMLIGHNEKDEIEVYDLT
ncbi:uncharacterized protein LOC128557806 [Mercenaria mercenaria]|uniref:uncharacterized protein LOC128557806 n=1 Tax=Mercenaria mercenaria TaxID=6596 RepID=UPI00234F73A7|nr:uncharacterized protein LOC128557806 [Mercenaria mercenaria]